MNVHQTLCLQVDAALAAGVPIYCRRAFLATDTVTVVTVPPDADLDTLLADVLRQYPNQPVIVVDEHPENRAEATRRGGPLDFFDMHEDVFVSYVPYLDPDAWAAAQDIVRASEFYRTVMSKTPDLTPVALDTVVRVMAAMGVLEVAWEAGA